MNNLTEKEKNELKSLEDPNIQFSTPSTAFLMGWYYKKQKNKRIEKLRAKRGDKDAVESINNKKQRIRFAFFYYIVYLLVFYFLGFLLNYKILAEIYLITFMIGLSVPWFIKRNK